MSTPRMTAALALLALIFAGFGLGLLAVADQGHPRRHVVVDRVPLDEVHPTGLKPGERRPGVVVAHGFSGSARLMAPFADSLTARGYVVVLLDFSGHGANTRPLPDDSASTGASGAALDHDLGVALAHLRTLRDVDPARVALVGHSMGATAVTRHAAAHPDVTSTVAISLPDAAGALTERPAHLLLLVGALEFPGFHEAAATAAEHGGTDREVRTVPGAEHISILYAPRAHHETTAWLDATLGGPFTDRPVPSPARRVTAAALLVFAALAAFPIVARLTLGRPPGKAAGGEPEEGPRPGRVAAAAGAVTVGALLAPVLPLDRLPIALDGFFAGFALVAGVLLIAYHRVRAGRATDDRRPAAVRTALAAVVLPLFAVAAVAVPLDLGVTHVMPAGPRWWVLPVLCAAFAVLGYGTELVAGPTRLGVPVVAGLVVVALTAAAVLGLTHGFVLLVVPVLAVLLAWQAVWSAILRRHGAPAWLTAVVGSVLIGLPLAAAPPLIG